MNNQTSIPVSWVGVHHQPIAAAVVRSPLKARMHSLDEDMLADTQNRMNLYNIEEFNIHEEDDDDDVFLDSVETIVSHHKQNHRHLNRRRSRISSNPDYQSNTVYVSVYNFYFVLVSLGFGGVAT